MLIILPYEATLNTLGFPGEYPADKLEIGDKDPIPTGWIVVTEEEWKRRFQTHYDAVSAIIESSEHDKAEAEKAKKLEVDGYYASLKTLKGKIASDGKLDASEQTQFNISLIDILIAKENSKL